MCHWTHNSANNNSHIVTFFTVKYEIDNNNQSTVQRKISITKQ